MNGKEERRNIIQERVKKANIRKERRWVERSKGRADGMKRERCRKKEREERKEEYTLKMEEEI